MNITYSSVEYTPGPVKTQEEERHTRRRKFGSMGGWWVQVYWPGTPEDPWRGPFEGPWAGRENAYEGFLLRKWFGESFFLSLFLFHLFNLTHLFPFIPKANKNTKVPLKNALLLKHEYKKKHAVLDKLLDVRVAFNRISYWSLSSL